MLTFEEDGTLISTNTNCCGHGDPEQLGPQSIGQGIWEKTGPNQATVTAIILISNPDGSHSVTMRVPLTMKFDEAFEIGEGPINTSVYLPTQDILNPDEVPLFTLEGCTRQGSCMLSNRKYDGIT